MNGGLRILRVMADKGPMRAADIGKMTGLSRQAANHHLRKLVRAGVVVHDGERYEAQEFVSKFNLDFISQVLSMLARSAVDQTKPVLSQEHEKIALATLWATVDVVQGELREQNGRFIRSR